MRRLSTGNQRLDAILIARKIKRLVRERYPKTEQRMGSLYMYAIMRSLTFAHAGFGPQYRSLRSSSSDSPLVNLTSL